MSPRSAAPTQVRRYGFPFRGLFNSLGAHEIPPSYCSAGVDMLVKPGADAEVGKLVKRRGSAVHGANTGVLEMVVADATMRGIEAFGLESETLTDGYPELCVLFADEAKRFGQYWLRTGGVDYTLGEDFGSTHYPTAASTIGNWKVCAMPYDGNSATGYTRAAYEENRRRLAAGTRRRVGVGGSEFGGGFLSTPHAWRGRRFNIASGSGSEKFRWQPMGGYPPLWAPTFPAASYPTRKATAAPWLEGDTFFVSVMWEWQDGSFSQPFIPRDKNTLLTSGLGLVVVDDDGDGTAEYFDWIPWRNLPPRPPGVKRTFLLRSPKKSKVQVAAGEWPDPLDLRITGVIDNDYQTSYDDAGGDDDSLVDDTDRMRLDHKWPERARYAWTFDQRVALGYLRPNPCAIVIAPAGVSVAYDINGDDDSALIHGSTAFTLRVTTAALELKSGSFASGAPGKTSISLSSTKSMGNLVDEINATAVGGAGRQWVAQLVPGSDANAPSDQLAPTIQAIVCATNSTTTVTSAALFGHVAEGMKVTGTGITAGTYVKSKASSSSLTLSATATATGAPTLSFHVDTGDETIFTDGELGSIRCWAGSNPQVLAYRQSWLDRYATAKRSFTYSAGGPNYAPFAADAFYLSVGTRRTAEDGAGVFMGGAALRNGSVMFYSNRIGWFVNEKGGGSGEDADYRLRWLEFGRGCISPYSIVQGNGWVGCMTADGFWVFDGSDREPAIITRTVFDRATTDDEGVGELAYTILVDTAAAASDGADFSTHAHYRDGRLWLKYRVSAGEWAILCYDATPSIESAGLPQLMRPDGSLFPWSLRLGYNWRSWTDGDALPGCIGSVRKSDGIRLYSCDDTNDKTRCGLVYQFEVPGVWTDGADSILEYAIGPQDRMGTMRRKCAQAISMVSRFVTTLGDVQTFSIRRDQGASLVTSIQLPRTTGAGVIYSDRRFELPLTARGPSKLLQWVYQGSGVGDEREISGLELEWQEMQNLD